MNIRVRWADPADAATLAAFNQAMAEESEGRSLEPETLLAGVTAALHDSNKGRYLLAECDGEPAGCLMLTLEWSDWRNACFWWIQSVYVAPSLRRAGVYSRLHQRVLDAARAAGACGVRLYVERDNLSAQATYRRLGMQATRYAMFEDSFQPE